MRNLSFSLFGFIILLVGCVSGQKSGSVISQDVSADTDKFPNKIAGSTIYEVNIRQFTEEGTFNAFAEHLPRLKELGVEILWLMPIHPISEKNRKGTLGSYYAPSDYVGVNPEFGTLEDFKALLDKVHKMGFYLIMDWVPNHTGRDHHWIKEHPEYYIRDDKGEITYEAMSADDVWWDTALLDHKNPETRKAMVEAMKFWVNLGVDGFRLDHGCGDKIPLYLWEEARATLDPIRDLFWLAECGHETFILDGSYADGFEWVMREVAAGRKPADELQKWMDDDMFRNGRSAFRLTYTTNHDLNSWIGTIFERFGDKHKAYAAFVFTSYGFPLILGGQEVGMSKRLQFFEKDPINWTDSLGLQPFYRSLVKLKKDNPALWAGEEGGFPVSIENNKDVVGFMRVVPGNKVVGIFNFSNTKQTVELTNPDVFGDYTEYFSGKKLSLNKQPISLNPGGYLVLTK